MKQPAQAVRILLKVVVSNQSLAQALTSSKTPLVKMLCYGVLRWYFQLTAITDYFLTKPLSHKDEDIYLLILTGLYQIEHLNTPDHVAVNETVACCKALKKQWATKLVNAILRKYLREKDTCLLTINKDDEIKYAHPTWIVNAIKQAWPDYWKQVLNYNNQLPPLTLRLYHQRVTPDFYSALLEQAELPYKRLSSHGAIKLEKPVGVEMIPGFKEGMVSVQDAGAQFAAPLLDLKPNQIVLDACAAPGGKTCHILELQPSLKLTAIDHDEQRLEKVKENINRIKLSAKLTCADVIETDAWWDKTCFDRILLDAPCSATGVIRRHPDIKLLRQESDITNLVKTQEAMLNALWPTLKPGGILLYVTCSVLPKENEENILKFISQYRDATLLPVEIPGSIGCKAGSQLLPSESHDGFYYAKIVKSD